MKPASTRRDDEEQTRSPDRHCFDTCVLPTTPICIFTRRGAFRAGHLEAGRRISSPWIGDAGFGVCTLMLGTGDRRRYARFLSSDRCHGELAIGGVVHIDLPAAQQDDMPWVVTSCRVSAAAGEAIISRLMARVRARIVSEFLSSEHCMNGMLNMAKPPSRLTFCRSPADIRWARRGAFTREPPVVSKRLDGRARSMTQDNRTRHAERGHEGPPLTCGDATPLGRMQVAQSSWPPAR